MAYRCTCLLENSDGPVEGPLEDGSFQIFQVDFEVRLPYDTELNKPQGSRRLEPLRLVYEKGQQSPLLMKTICLSLNCPKIELKWYKTMGKGSEEVFFITTLTNARIINLREWMPFTKVRDQENIGHMEEIAIVAASYNWTFTPKGVEHEEKQPFPDKA